MEQPGPFPTEEYRPLQIPRKGEYTAWVLASGGALSWFLLGQAGLPVLAGLKVLCSLLAASALLISLSNWSDRRTRLIMDDNGISYFSGLRKSRLAWDEITRVEAASTRWGKRVRVSGKPGFFDFRTFAEASFQGRLQAGMGFEKGEQILRRVISSARLSRSNTSDPGWILFTKEPSVPADT